MLNRRVRVAVDSSHTLDRFLDELMDEIHEKKTFWGNCKRDEFRTLENNMQCKVSNIITAINAQMDILSNLKHAILSAA